MKKRATVYCSVCLKFSGREVNTTYYLTDPMKSNFTSLGPPGAPLPYPLPKKIYNYGRPLMFRKQIFEKNWCAATIPNFTLTEKVSYPLKLLEATVRVDGFSSCCFVLSQNFISAAGDAGDAARLWDVAARLSESDIAPVLVAFDTAAMEVGLK